MQMIDPAYHVGRIAQELPRMTLAELKELRRLCNAEIAKQRTHLERPIQAKRTAVAA